MKPSARALLLFLLGVVCACGAPASKAPSQSAVASDAKPTTPIAADACQQVIISLFRDAPFPATITLFSTPGAVNVDAKGAALTAWLEALASRSGSKVETRWVSVVDDAGRAAAREAGLSPEALARSVKPGDTAVVLEDTFFGVTITYGVDEAPILLGKVTNTAARGIAGRAMSRERHVGFVVGGSADGGVRLDQTELVVATSEPSRFRDFAAQLERVLPNHKLEAVELAKGVPDATDVLVVTQPGSAVTEAERQSIDDFLMRGDKTLLVIASAVAIPPYAAGMHATIDDHGLARLLGPYGVGLSSDAIVDTRAAFRIEVVKGDGTRGTVAMPAIPMAEVERSSAPFFGLGAIAFPFASSLTVHSERQPGAEVRVIARTSKAATLLTTSGVALGPDATPPNGNHAGAHALAVQVRGDVKSAFTKARAPATVFVLSSSLLPSNPLAWAGNAPVAHGAMSMMMPPAGDARLQQLAPSYAPQLTSAFRVLMNAIDARAVDDEVRACSSLLVAEEDATSVTPAATNHASRYPRALAPGARTSVLEKDAAARITRLQIRGPKGSSILQRNGAVWRVVSPVAAEADVEHVRQAIENLTEMTLDEAIANGSGAEGMLGIAGDEALHVVASAGTETLVELTLGRSGSRGTAVLSKASPGVRVARGCSRYLLERESWRRSAIWNFERDEVKRVEVQVGVRKWAFDRSKGGVWAGSLDGKAFAAVSPEQIDALINGFRHLQASGFAEPGADTGVDAGNAVRFELNSGRRVSLHIGKAAKVPGGGRYARVDGDPTIFVIDEYAAQWSDVTAERLRL